MINEEMAETVACQSYIVQIVELDIMLQNCNEIAYDPYLHCLDDLFIMSQTIGIDRATYNEIYKIVNERIEGTIGITDVINKIADLYILIELDTHDMKDTQLIKFEHALDILIERLNLEESVMKRIKEIIKRVSE